MSNSSVFRDLKKIAVQTQPECNNTCLCRDSDKEHSVAYYSGGCLKCVKQDCAYYIMNFNDAMKNYML